MAKEYFKDNFLKNIESRGKYLSEPVVLSTCKSDRTSRGDKVEMTDLIELDPDDYYIIADDCINFTNLYETLVRKRDRTGYQ